MSKPEPETYRERRDILEGLLDLRMTYLDGNLTITGKVPVPDAADSTTSKGKKCGRRIDGDHVSAPYIPFILNEAVA